MDIYISLTSKAYKMWMPIKYKKVIEVEIL